MKIKTVLCLIFIAAALQSNPCSADVLGQWAAVGEFKETFVGPGGRRTAYVPLQEQMGFGPGGAFTGMGTVGSWSQRGKRASVYADKAPIEAAWEQQFSAQGYDVTVIITQLTITATEQRNGSLKGTLKARGNIYFSATGSVVRGTVTARYTATRTSTMGIHAADVVAEIQ